MLSEVTRFTKTSGSKFFFKNVSDLVTAKNLYC